MESYKREFIKFLEDAGVLKFGDFTAKSGRKIPYFINAGDIKTGEQIQKLGEFYAKAYFENYMEKKSATVQTVRKKKTTAKAVYSSATSHRPAKKL